MWALIVMLLPYNQLRLYILLRTPILCPKQTLEVYKIIDVEKILFISFHKNVYHIFGQLGSSLAASLRIFSAKRGSPKT